MRCYDKYLGTKWSLVGICLLCCLLNACHKGRMEPLSDDEEVILTFSVKLPGVPLGGLKTYALTSPDENLLKDVDVLVFTDDGSGMKFRYRSVGTVIEQSTGVSVPAEIKVRLWRTGVDSRLVIIANARQQVNAYDFHIGVTTPEDVQQGLVYVIDAPEGKWLADAGNFTPLPMWGQPDDIENGINGQVILGNVTLLRSLARVDVVVDENADDFVLTEVWVFNSKTNGLIIPYPGNLAGGVAQIPSLPSGGPVNNNAPLEYYQTAGENSVREIYLFEADAQLIDDADATALVIGGRYATDTDPTYYRIDFRSPIDPTNTAYPVLRNRRYQVTITEARGRGHIDEQTAFNASSVDPLVAYSRSTGLIPAQAGQSVSPSRLRKYGGIAPRSTKGITYTVTTINESQ